MLLSVDTAGPVIGAACGSGHFSQRIVRGADAVLTPALAELIEGIQVSGVVVSVGPGAFTGLRVGVAAALGLAVALGVPVLPVSSLRARAALVAPAGRVLALLDGRKGRAYAALYQDGSLQGEEQDVPPQVAIAQAGGDFLAIGEGALVWRSLIQEAGGRVDPDAGRSPAHAMLTLGELLQPQRPEALRIRYIRAPDAKKPGLS